ncbi:MAG TPA: PHB depolymerase family esterase [Polyangiaceae bacterium]
MSPTAHGLGWWAAGALLLASLVAGCLGDAPQDQGANDAGPGGAAGHPDSGRSGSGGGSGSGSSSGGSFGGDGGTVTGDAEGPAGDAGIKLGAAAPCKASGTFGAGMTMFACVPTGLEGKTGQPVPLVVAMHGYTQGAYQQPASGQPATPKWGYVTTTQWAVLAEAYKFYVVFADTGPGAPSFQWYSSPSRGDIQSSAIVAMVDAMKQAHTIDASRVYANGLSSGAFMTVVMLAEYPDVFAGGSTFEGGAYGCTESCAALGKQGQGWTWPGNHPASSVVDAYPTVWSDPGARKPSLLVFQGEKDGAVTPENMADLVQQWSGALGIPATSANAALGISTTLKGQQYTVYAKGGQVQLATVFMPGIGHGTPVDPGPGSDQGGWDPMPSKTMVNDPNLVQDWTNTAGIWGVYYSARFWGLVP